MTVPSPLRNFVIKFLCPGNLDQKFTRNWASILGVNFLVRRGYGNGNGRELKDLLQEKIDKIVIIEFR